MKFVTNEIALKLKEKGFREPCLAHYNIGTSNEDVVLPNVYIPLTGDMVSYRDLLRCYNEKKLGVFKKIDAPTIDQVLGWMRSKGIYTYIYPFLKDDGSWNFTFHIQTKDFYESSKSEYSSHDEANLVLIEYVLDKLI